MRKRIRREGGSLREEGEDNRRREEIT